MSISLEYNYKKDDVNMVMIEQFQHFSYGERFRLITLLNKFEDMFNSMLCTWNITPVILELKDNVKPVY